MKQFDLLHFKRDGSIGIVNINQSSRSKSFVVQLSQELSGICDAVSLDESILVLIITGDSEKTFSYDVTPEESKKNAINGILPSISEPVSNIAIPVIAASKGDATGQGLELVLACDFRIFIETAMLGFPNISAGIMPYNGGTQRLPRLVGMGKALEMLLTGNLIDAKEAYRIGLVNRVVNNKELMTSALELAQALVTKGPIALRYAKEAVLKGIDLTLDQGLHLETDLYSLLQTTADRVEGIQAFRQKRKPEFKGI